MLSPKQKMQGVLFLAFALIFLSISMVSAVDTFTLVSPATSGTMAGSAILNSSFTGYAHPADTFLVNITYYAQSASTANSTWVTLNSTNNVNLTASNSTQLTFNTLVLEDGNDYIFNVTYSNITLLRGGTTSTSVVVDKSAPSTPTSLTPTSDVDGIFTISSTVAGLNTTACTLNFIGKNPGSASYSMTHTGNVCSRDFTGVPEETYIFTITATDGTNTSSASSEQTLNIDIPSGSTLLPSTDSQNLSIIQGDNILTKQIWILPVWIWAVIIVIVVIAIKAKGR